MGLRLNNVNSESRSVSDLTRESADAIFHLSLFGTNDNGSPSGESCGMRLVSFNLNFWHSTPASSNVSHSDCYSPLGGGDISQAYVKKVSARIERSAKQTRGILSM